MDGNNGIANNLPCIKCGACLAPCPARLSPLRLFALWLDGETERMRREESLEACIQCRKCDAVCPSGLPLSDSFAAAAKQSEKRREMRERAARLRERHENHLRRLAAPPRWARLDPAALAARAQRLAAEDEQKTASG
ncbi:MAG: 4Fe-4S dicluster domain-containing protein [Gammaproteobacteria bacterium]